eukprot:10399455-Ditylum_brightwellii.AAC.1
MTVVQLKKELEDHGVERKVFRTMRKASLVELLFTERQKSVVGMDTDDSCSSLSIALPCDNDQAQSPITPVRNCNLAHTSPGSSSMDLATKGHCTFLILDEDLQRLPFECLELFSGVT